MTIRQSVGLNRSRGEAAADALTDAGVGARQEDVAERLGITQQAVSQRLRTALWSEELAARPAAARLLVAASAARAWPWPSRSSPSARHS